MEDEALNPAWATGVDPELAFWKHWLETRGDRWPEDYNARIDPDSELQPEIASFVTNSGESLKILDVGAGPVSYVGKVFNGAPIDLTAVDALGDLYSRLEFPPGLPLVRTRNCDSEALSTQFSRDSFDVVFSRNALDHGYDPIKAIREMIVVAKPRRADHNGQLAERGSSRKLGWLPSMELFL